MGEFQSWRIVHKGSTGLQSPEIDAEAVWNLRGGFISGTHYVLLCFSSFSFRTGECMRSEEREQNTSVYFRRNTQLLLAYYRPTRFFVRRIDWRDIPQVKTVSFYG